MLPLQVTERRRATEPFSADKTLYPSERRYSPMALLATVWKSKTIRFQSEKEVPAWKGKKRKAEAIFEELRASRPC